MCDAPRRCVAHFLDLRSFANFASLYLSLEQIPGGFGDRPVRFSRPAQSSGAHNLTGLCPQIVCVPYLSL